ncbi:hypothetical protein V8B97DRAFT_1916950 [Scleroderma yunnanense]
MIPEIHKQLLLVNIERENVQTTRRDQMGTKLRANIYLRKSETTPISCVTLAHVSGPTCGLTAALRVFKPKGTHESIPEGSQDRIRVVNMFPSPIRCENAMRADGGGGWRAAHGSRAKDTFAGLAGLEILYGKLRQMGIASHWHFHADHTKGVAENDEVVAFITIASALLTPPAIGSPRTGFNGDDGASLLMAFHGLQDEPLVQGKT